MIHWKNILSGFQKSGDKGNNLPDFVNTPDNNLSRISQMLA
jgi:hypothetical protein